MANLKGELDGTAKAFDNYASSAGRAAGISFSTGGGRLAPSGYAQGGGVAGGRAIIVGEQGPELFVPPSSGTIVPNHALGGSSSGGGWGTSTSGGGGNTYVLNIGTVYGIDDLKRQVQSWIRDAAAGQSGYTRGYLQGF
jgi:hypothetical protein